MHELDFELAAELVGEERSRSLQLEKLELGREEPGEIQQGQGQGPAPGEEQPHAPVRAGADLLESRLLVWTQVTQVIT